MFEKIIQSGLKDTPHKFFEVVNEEATARMQSNHGGWHWHKVRLGFTLLELAESLLTSFNEVKTYTDKPGFDEGALCGLPYKAAICTKAAFALAASERSDQYVDVAKYYYGFAMEGIETIKERFPSYQAPYEFRGIDKPPKLIRAVVMPQ